MMWRWNEFADNAAVVTDEEQFITYKQLGEMSESLSRHLTARALVLCLNNNSIGALLGYVTCVQYKSVAILMSDRLRDESIRAYVERYKPSFVWAPDYLVHSCLTQNSGMRVVYSVLGYCLLQTAYGSWFSLHDELALLLATSGTTGNPKLVRLSYTNVQSNAEAIIDYLHIDESQRAMLTLPIHYSFGLSIVNTHLLSGASIILSSDSMVQKPFWFKMKKLEATSLSGVPFTFDTLQKLNLLTLDLPYLQTITQAGGKLQPQVHQTMATYADQSHKRFFVMYGQTEATARMSFLPAENSLQKIGSIGVPIKGGQFELYDEFGHAIHTPFHAGELVYKGKNVMLGYANCGADLAKGDEQKGVLYTGDCACFDEEGYYYITGRLNRWIKYMGTRVQLDDIESMIMSIDDTIDVACTGNDDGMVLYVTNTSTSDLLKQHVTDRTGIRKSFIRVVEVSEIPRNAAGKILYHQL